MRTSWPVWKGSQFGSDGPSLLQRRRPVRWDRRGAKGNPKRAEGSRHAEDRLYTGRASRIRVRMRDSEGSVAGAVRAARSRIVGAIAMLGVEAVIAEATESVSDAEAEPHTREAIPETVPVAAASVTAPKPRPAGPELRITPRFPMIPRVPTPPTRPELPNPAVRRPPVPVTPVPPNPAPPKPAGGSRRVRPRGHRRSLRPRATRRCQSRAHPRRAG